MRDRASYEFALASAAVALEVHGGTIAQARWRSAAWRRSRGGRGGGEALVGAGRARTLYAAAARGARRAPSAGTNAFKIELAQRSVIVRALTTVGVMP